MVNIIITLIICATIVTTVKMLQEKGLPTITIAHKEDLDYTPATEVEVPVEEEELTVKEQKELLLRDPSAAISAYLEGEYDLGI